LVRRPIAVLALVCLLLSIFASDALGRSGWKRDLDRIVRNKPIGVSVRDQGKTIYSWSAKKKRIPASNQKLLLSMALLDRMRAHTTLATSALGRNVEAGALRGNLYVVGRGDPTISSGHSYASSLPLEATYVGRLAKRIKASGVSRIGGSVVGANTYFAHDWWASGWKSFFPSSEVALPAALNLNGNTVKGRHVANPEKRLATALTERLRSIGVRVGRRPKTGGMPPAYARNLVAKVQSPQLSSMLRYMNRTSSNFFAEVLGKLLSVQRSGPPGTIAKGGHSIRSWAARYNVRVRARDSSGLSSANRVSPKGLTKLLGVANKRSWGGTLRDMLPTGGQGTLEDRLRGVPVRAKTGTLSGISTLSGWVRLKRVRSWGEFSIMSRGMSKPKAAQIEDRIVRLLRSRARH
jgi:D-alanyl-D-alanine carboxypeptidase/D-alanyl-D-alanine-endopeptidase (penicillin-binding protein 4)